MKMKILVQLVAALVLIKAVSALEQKPNAVFVFSDDHAPHAIGAYDGWLKSVNPTPVIDRLASEGMLFVNSFCTNSICGPSRAVIQTGKHSHKNGFMNNGNTFDWNQQTFPKLLQKPAIKPQYTERVTSRANLRVMMIGRSCRDKDCITTPT